MPHVAHNSGNQEWYTPSDIIERVRSVFGGKIDLDPASCAEANATVQAERYYSAQENGLDLPWSGNVFLNPPYTRGLVDLFIRKAIAERNSDHGMRDLIILTNNATETVWFADICSISTMLCFPRRRVRYLSPGRASLSPLQGQVIIFCPWSPWGNERFARAFGNLGTLCYIHASAC